MKWEIQRQLTQGFCPSLFLSYSSWHKIAADSQAIVSTFQTGKMKHDKIQRLKSFSCKVFASLIQKKKNSSGISVYVIDQNCVTWPRLAAKEAWN